MRLQKESRSGRESRRLEYKPGEHILRLYPKSVKPHLQRHSPEVRAIAPPDATPWKGGGPPAIGRPASSMLRSKRYACFQVLSKALLTSSKQVFEAPDRWTVHRPCQRPVRVDGCKLTETHQKDTRPFVVDKPARPGALAGRIRLTHTGPVLCVRPPSSDGVGARRSSPPKPDCLEKFMTQPLLRHICPVCLQIAWVRSDILHERPLCFAGCAVLERLPDGEKVKRPTKPKAPKTLDLGYIQQRSEGVAAAGYDVPKWLWFCRLMIEAGCTVEFYEVKASKYITVWRFGRKFKVRFSNHGGTRISGDTVDFFVGRNSFGTTTTQDAIEATAKALDLPGLLDRHNQR